MSAADAPLDIEVYKLRLVRIFVCLRRIGGLIGERLFIKRLRKMLQFEKPLSFIEDTENSFKWKALVVGIRDQILTHGGSREQSETTILRVIDIRKNSSLFRNRDNQSA